MSVRNFVLAHREELLQACRAELVNARTAEQVAADLQAEFLALTETAFDSDTAAVGGGPDPLTLVGDSPAVTALKTRIDQLSRRSRAPVVVYGEAGTGKRHCARALHRATHPKGFWFELEDASDLPELESHLLALSKSTSAEAEAGTTVYVHQLAEAPSAIQARVSKLLQEQSLPFRVIVSSTRPLVVAARNQSLQSDLAFRFPNELKLPPLCERKEDIAPLVRHFAALYAARHGCGLTTLSPDALRVLLEHSWPGNASELSHFVERLASDVGPGVVEPGDLPDLGDRPSGMVLTLPAHGIDFAQLERQLLVQALALAGNNQTRAGALLGLSRDQIRYRMAKFDLLAVSARGG